MELTFEMMLEDARSGARVQLARQAVEPERVARGYRIASIFAGELSRTCVVSPDEAHALRLLGAVDVLRATRD